MENKECGMLLDQKLNQIKNDHFRLRVKNFLLDSEIALSLADTPEELVTANTKMKEVLINLIKSEQWSGPEVQHDSDLAEKIVNQLIWKRRQEITDALKSH